MPQGGLDRLSREGGGALFRDGAGALLGLLGVLRHRRLQERSHLPRGQRVLGARGRPGERRCAGRRQRHARRLPLPRCRVNGIGPERPGRERQHVAGRAPGLPVMRLHVISLPHTQTTSAYNQCAYTAKATRFCSMMTDLGHDVILYGSEENEARCAELVTCITREQQRAMIPPGEVYAIDFDPSLNYWQHFNHTAIAALHQRLEPRDFICLTVGDPHRVLAEAFPNHIVVETGVGYEGILPSTFKVYESYAWMHAMYGKGGPTAADGRAFDAVIPNFYDVDDFPPGDGEGGYFAFLSRMTQRKGPTI